MAEILYESNYYGVSNLGDSLCHHGIKGQKWGIRRFQNEDGSLTALGKQRYGTVENFNKSQERKSAVGRALKGMASAATSNKKDGSWTKATASATASNQDSWAAKPKTLPGVVNRSFAGNSNRSQESKSDVVSKALDKNIKQGKDKPNVSAAEKITKDARRGMDDVNRLADKAVEKRAGKQAKTMSNEELAKAIERIRLETSYKEAVKKSKSVDSGMEKVRDILDTTGAVVGIAASAAAIATTVHELRKK